MNIGIDFMVKLEPGKQEALVLQECYDAITEELGSYKLQMGETIFRSHLVKALSRVPYVMTVLELNIIEKSGGGYSDIFYDLENKMLRDGTGFYAEKDVCFELRYPENDIRGAVER